MEKKGYRLPTEAEWEFAASNRGSKDNQYAGTNDLDSLGNYAWYMENSYNMGESHANFGSQHPGKKLPNELGLYDMSGNIGEFCWDWYSADRPEGSKLQYYGPDGPVDYFRKIVKGGTWLGTERACNVSHRAGLHWCDQSGSMFGFRLACSAWDIDE